MGMNTHLRWFRQALLAARANWPTNMRPHVGFCEYCGDEGHLTFESTRGYYSIGNDPIPSHEDHSHLCLKCALANDTRIKRERQRLESQREYEMQRREYALFGGIIRCCEHSGS